jgi:hypothetical protein
VTSSSIIGPWRMPERLVCGYPLPVSSCESVTGNFDNRSNLQGTYHAGLVDSGGPTLRRAVASVIGLPRLLVTNTMTAQDAATGFPK